MKKYFKHIITFTCLCLALNTFASDAWMENFKDAKAKAKKEGKSLLVDFTGSDWCGWCKRLDKEVFSKETFQKEASKKFVFVKLDFPRNKQNLSEEIQLQNKKLAGKYKISGFPTILIMDCNGEAFAKTGYRNGGPEKYVEHLNGLLKKNEELKKEIAGLNKLTGDAKTKALNKIVGLMSVDNKRKQDLIDQIIKLDVGNKLGLKNKYAFGKEMAKVEALLRARKTEEVMTLCSNLLKNKEYTAEQYQQVMLIQAQVLFMTNKKDESKALLIKAKALKEDSKTAKSINSILNRMFK